MSFFKQISDNIAKIKSYKDDIAPMGLCFDLFSSPFFKIPVLPVPLRIDKITNGESTLLISPDLPTLQKVSDELNLYINFEQFVLYGLRNLTSYAQNKYKELTNRTLENDKILEWYYRSLIIESEISALKKDFTYLIEHFLRLYHKIEDLEIGFGSNTYNDELIAFCDKIIDFFRSRLEKNEIEVQTQEESVKKEIYKKRRSKYFPEMVKVQIKTRKEETTKEMSFVPYLIYDDIIDIFYYNKKLLSKNEQEPINLKVYSENNIIIKGSNIFDYTLTTNQNIYYNVKISKLEKILNENRKK